MSLDHAGESRGGLVYEGGSLDHSLRVYRDAVIDVSEGASKIFAIRLEGNLPTSALGGLDQVIAETRVVPSDATIVTVPFNVRNGSDLITVIQTAGESETATASDSTSTVKPWAPVSGKVETLNKYCDADTPFCVGITRDAPHPLLVGETRGVAPGCRNWTTGQDSTAC